MPAQRQNRQKTFSLCSTASAFVTKTVTHPPLYTVADSQSLRGQIDGGHTKNLFVKDKKDNYFLLTVGEEAMRGPEDHSPSDRRRLKSFVWQAGSADGPAWVSRPALSLHLDQSMTRMAK